MENNISLEELKQVKILALNCQRKDLDIITNINNEIKKRTKKKNQKK